MDNVKVTENRDNRSVATDALASLGTIIGDSEKRDAIHLAVEPVTAGETLYPGQDIGLGEDGRAYGEGKLVGIVDPFLKQKVREGNRFWLIIYPRQITSLRHVWSHPDFEETAETVKVEKGTSDHDKSKSWIEGFAVKLDQTYNRLMEAAETWLDAGKWNGYTYDNSETYKAYYDQFPEFWKHYAVVTGKEVPKDKRESFFTCSC